VSIASTTIFAGVPDHFCGIANSMMMCIYGSVYNICQKKCNNLMEYPDISMICKGYCTEGNLSPRENLWTFALPLFFLDPAGMQ
jgi:hypothetical protein